MGIRSSLTDRKGSATDSPPVENVIREGNLDFTEERGGNNSGPSYQGMLHLSPHFEACGAPVEAESPLGYEVSWCTVILLNVGQMVGTGVFSTPGSILRGIGSVGLSLVYWAIGVLIAMSGLCVYLELASYFPNRSGGEVVYLEQGWPRPKYFLPTAFAAFKVIFAFSSSNAIVLSTYAFRAAGKEPSEWQSKAVAVAGYTAATLIVTFSNKYSLWFANGITCVKLCTLLFIGVTGLVVLAGGVSSVPDPGFNFRNAFAGTTSEAYGITNALVRINFAYVGWENCFNVVAEIKNPIKTVKRAGPISLCLVAVLYMLCNIAYFAAIPKQEIIEGNTIAASLFFSKVFGSGSAARSFNILILLSAFGNLVGGKIQLRPTSLLVASTDQLRRVADLDFLLLGDYTHRPGSDDPQGVLPFPRFWASTQPFGTPLGPYSLKYVATIIMILGPPFGDAFNFAVDLASYPNAVFGFFMGLGVYTIRRQRKKINVGRTDFRAWDAVVLFYIAVQVFLLAMPWVPPADGVNGGNVSFFYASAILTGIGLLGVCALYYYLWIQVLPKRRGYEIRQELIVLETGEATNNLVNVPISQLAEWDRTHDVAGKRYPTITGVQLKGEENSEAYQRHVKEQVVEAKV
ncbi:high-affinity methionine permease [Drepanopeziza brunnea f. sp. 'multigermtubi' MB_m1]|uniref:High-affinity methionine permease n=1 Tax=Marssonina brunnea f. sp. multigermtubi (strain MB_m1) TaxID=1072389 RepID=K1WUD0_MARBU|nr:high-affinity methionine permease [Drepanopeziza brunnea f. sp. 'multigermtubi' MB_m1]EKD16057.1 high-affinity methionine permease [Drepanopeziza brunnea f. sp. 'multigermtubi' MB_m1]